LCVISLAFGQSSKLGLDQSVEWIVRYVTFNFQQNVSR